MTPARHDEILIDNLSPRRRAVLELIAKGLTNDEIGSVLEISPATVRTHITGVLSAIGVTNRTEAAALFLTSASRTGHVDKVMARPAIAVLPLEALSDDPRAKLLTRGLTDDLLALFARWTWFPVIASVASNGARSLGGTPPEIGQRIGARFLVDGTLRTDGASWRLVVRLDDTENDRCLWSERYDFAQGALFEIQDEVTAAIVTASYRVMVSSVLAEVPRRPPTDDLPAWELAHEGMALQAQRSLEANLRAQERFRRALERDSTLVLAHFGLGLCHFDALLNQWEEEGRACDALAACAQRCTEFSPQSAEGYFLQGRLWQARGEPLRGQPSMLAAVSRNPSFAVAHATLGHMLLMAGKLDEGIARTHHASRLGPGVFVAGFALAHFLRGEDAEALSLSEGALKTNPHYTFARAMAAASAYYLGDLDRARMHVHELRTPLNGFNPKQFLLTFGAQVDGVERLFRALSALGLDH